ncbi:MAG: TrkH family potassium uptake protein [Prolixibacteraceae bacterium]
MDIEPLKKYREKFFKYWFLAQDFLREFSRFIKSIGNVVFTLATLAYLGVLLLHIGFRFSDVFTSDFYKLYHYTFYVIYTAKYLEEFLNWRKRRIIGWIYEGSLFLLSTVVLFYSILVHIGQVQLEVGIPEFVVLIIASALLIVSEIYKLMSLLDNIKLSPSLLFALSFIVIIFCGAGLLKLPNAHVLPLTFLDALFTSASAVCVTGLIVVDTATEFTFFGQIVIMVLIQIGGLGIMAFTGFFGFIFTGTVSFKDRLMLKDIMSSDTLGGVFRLITKIILFTFLIEALGAAIIYFNVGPEIQHRFFFSVFHAVSAFCNAGFSTLSAGLASPELLGNYWVSLTIANLIILGGIGFPVLILMYAYLKNYAYKILNSSRKKKMPAAVLQQNIGVRIAVSTTIFLLVLGTVAYYLLENKGSLNAWSDIDKWVIAFFGSVSARTAGFNVVDISAWTYPTVFLMIFLMWVGGSPGSTSGGIKTTTFALALHTTYNFIRGRNSIHVGFRKIGNETIRRVLVTIVLSVITIFIGFVGVMLADPEKNPTYLLFECVSAYATVGLSIVNTALLSSTSKSIIIVIMFVGRVGPLALLTGIFKIHHMRYHKYPIQDLVIN